MLRIVKWTNWQSSAVARRCERVVSPSQPNCQLNWVESRHVGRHALGFRLILGARKFDHVTPLLRERHWLPVEHHITFKIAIMTYKCVHSLTTDYLADYIWPPASAASNLRLRSNSFGRLFVPRSKTAAETGLLQWLATLVEQSTSLCHISRFSGHLQKELKTFLFRSAYDWWTYMFAFDTFLFCELCNAALKRLVTYITI